MQAVLSRRVMWMLVSFALGASAVAQPPATGTESAPEQAGQRLTQLDAATSRSSLLGVDADGDGIRDDIEAIVANNPEAKVEEHSVQAPSARDQGLSTLGEKRQVRRPPPRRGCFDYLLMSPKDQYKTDLRLKGRTNGMLGTHPCDPVVSPLRERPFDTDFLELDLGPVLLRYP